MDVNADDWRVTEGPAIGLEPELELSEISFQANFYVTGGMSRMIGARLSTITPIPVESLGRSLSELNGYIRIFDHLPAHTYPGLFPDHFGHVELAEQRGAMAMLAEHFAMHLYLPPDQFALSLPLFSAPSRKAQLRIEIERTLDQGLLDNEKLFWNDRLSPVILFNEFQLSS